MSAEGWWLIALVFAVFSGLGLGLLLQLLLRLVFKAWLWWWVFPRERRIERELRQAPYLKGKR